MARRRSRSRRRKRKSYIAGLPRGLALAVAIGALATVAAVAFILTRPVVGGDQQAVCVLVVDRTGSSSDEATLRAYRDAANQTIDGCVDRQAELTTYYFDQATQKLTVVNPEPYALFMEEGRNEAQLHRMLEDEIELARTEIASVFESAPPAERQSDILSALKSAGQGARVLASESSMDEAYLVVITDGVQLGSGVSVAALDEDSSADPLVEEAESLRLIPDLSGVHVNFVGVRSGRTNTGDQIPEWFEGRIEEFWRGIVQRGGGDLCLYASSAPRLPVDC